jgi:hypothetical protein
MRFISYVFSMPQPDLKWSKREIAPRRAGLIRHFPYS